MATKLNIVWDGNVKGLAEHRVSVSAFGSSINILTQVLRRIASDIVKNAIPNSERSLQGNYASQAKNIDIEIETIEVGSAGLGAFVTFTPPVPFQLSMMGDLDQRAALEFVDSVEKESKGIWQDKGVRKFLLSLPSGLTKQKYSVSDESGKLLREPVEITSLHLAEMPKSAPVLCRHYGNIIAIGFEPGRTEIKLKRTDGRVVSLGATKEQVMTAWSLRDSNVKVLSVLTGIHRLLKLEEAEAKDFETTPEKVKTHIFGRWDELLRRLAQ